MTDASSHQHQHEEDEKPNLCCFLEIFKNFIGGDGDGSENDLNNSNNDNNNDFQKQQAIALPISPYLIHQILRSEGFATKIMIFSKPALQQHHQSSQSSTMMGGRGGGIDEQSPNAKDLFVRCLVQFETGEQVQKVLARYGSRQGVLVFLQTISCMMLRIRAKPSREKQIFVTENTETTLAVTPEYAQFLGADFPRTVSAVQQQRLEQQQLQQRQQQQRPTAEIFHHNRHHHHEADRVARIEQALSSAAAKEQPEETKQSDTSVSIIKQTEETKVQEQQQQQQDGVESDSGPVARRRRGVKYQAPSIREREE